MNIGTEAFITKERGQKEVKETSGNQSSAHTASEATDLVVLKHMSQLFTPLK